MRIFLCHAAFDKPRIRQLYKQLKQDGHTPWLDEEDLLPGQDWQREIPKAVRASDVVLVCLSQHAITKTGYVQKEIRFALDAADEQPEDTIYIIPARLEECKIPDQLARWHWVDFFSDGSYEKLLRSLSVAEGTKDVTQEVRDLSITEPIHGWSADKVKTLQKQTADALGLSVIHRDALKDGSEGPAMVIIPAGTFVMGSPENEPQRRNNETQRTVTIDQPFFLSETAVTFAEYDQYCRVTQKEKPNDSDWGRGNRPVINVSWGDAAAYCQWLSDQTGERYQLPTEAQWEYSCRAGATTPFWFGDQITTDQVNYNGNYPYNNGERGAYRKETVDAKSFAPNSWGLYQMHGNVWEWCADWYGDYDSAQSVNPTGLAEGGDRVLRGGSWFNLGLYARSACRDMNQPDCRVRNIGFRFARGQVKKQV